MSDFINESNENDNENIDVEATPSINKQGLLKWNMEE